MALETLKNVTKIGNFDVIHMDDLKEKFPEKFNESGAMDYKWFEKEIRPTNFIYIRHDVNSISFTIQNGPIKEVGVIGCQVDELILTALLIIKGLNEKFPDRNNVKAMSCLYEACAWLQQRKHERKLRGIEGMSKA